MDSRIAASQNEDEVKLLGREYLYLRQLSRPPHDGLGQHQILRMNALITRLNKIDLTLVPWLNLDQADRRGTAPSQLALDIDYDPLSSNLTAEQEEREARRCMAAVRIIFPGLYQSLKTGEKYCGEGFVERYGCTIQQGEDVFNGFCSGKQADVSNRSFGMHAQRLTIPKIIAEDNRMMLANIANNARLQSDRSYLQVEAARATVNEGLASKKQKLMEKNNTLTIDGNSALQQAAVDLSSSSQIIEHAASTSGQALLPVSNIIHLPESSTASALKQIRTPTLDAKVIPTILENSPQELQQKLAPAMSMASSSVIHDASVPQTASNTGETLIVPDKPVESPQRFFIKNSHTKNASASIGDPSGRSSKSAITSLKQPSSFSTSESSTAMDICEPESMMEISAAGSAMEISDEEGQINEDVACPQLTSPASLAQKNGNNIPKKHQNKEAFAAVQQQDHNINMEPRRRYYSKFEYPPDGPSAYSWGVARHWGARPPPGAYRPDNVVFTDGITASRSSLSTSPSRKTANDPPPSYSPTPPPAASHIIVAQQPNRIMPARVGGSSVPFDHRVEAAIQDPTLSSLPPVPANLPPRPANRATTPPQAARSLMRGPVDPDSPTPWRSPGGKLHRSGPPLSQSRPRPSPSRPSQQVGGLVPVDWNGSSHFEYVIMKLYSRNQRDEAATRLQRLIDDDLAYGLLKIVSLPNDKSIKVSGPHGFRTRDNLVRLFPEAKSFAHATN
jgi:hypothetical protein